MRTHTLHLRRRLNRQYRQSAKQKQQHLIQAVTKIIPSTLIWNICALSTSQLLSHMDHHPSPYGFITAASLIPAAAAHSPLACAYVVLHNCCLCVHNLQSITLVTSKRFSAPEFTLSSNPCWNHCSLHLFAALTLSFLLFDACPFAPSHMAHRFERRVVVHMSQSLL